MSTSMDALEKNDELESISRKPTWTDSDAQKFIRASAESGVPVMQFCKKYGISEQRFYTWKRKLYPTKPVASSAVVPAKLLPVRIIRSKPQGKPRKSIVPEIVGRTGTIEIVIGRRCVRVSPDFDASHLRRVVVALEEDLAC